MGKNALNDYHGFAGTIEERLSDLLWALREPSVKAIMCSRGGDGAAHLLTRLSPDTLRQYPKLIIGFSDVTALLCAEARVGVKGIHGSMCHALNTYEGNDTVSLCLRRMLQGDLPTYSVAPHSLNVEGREEGIIVGQFSKYKHPENGFDDMYAMLHEYLRHYNIPVCYDFPVGHAHLRNFPLLTGTKATLSVTPDGATLYYAR